MVLNVRNVYNLLFETQLPMLFLYVTVYFLLLHKCFNLSYFYSSNFVENI